MLGQLSDGDRASVQLTQTICDSSLMTFPATAHFLSGQRSVTESDRHPSRTPALSRASLGPIPLPSAPSLHLVCTQLCTSGSRW